MRINSRLLRKGIGRRASAGCCAGAILLLAAGAADASAGAARHSGASAAPVVDVADGAVRGRTAGAVHSFLGIPYAAPRWVRSAGALRSRPPAGVACATPPSMRRTARR